MLAKRWMSAAALSLCLFATASAEIKGLSNPKAYTQTDWIRDDLDYNRRTLVDAYKAHGHHDLRWDADAEKFLEMMSRYFIHGATSEFYPVSGLPKNSDIEAAGAALIAKGCDDPLVLDMAAVGKNDTRKNTDVVLLLQKAVEPMLKSDYPSERVANCVRRAVTHFDRSEDPQRVDDLAAQLVELHLKTLRRTDWPGIDRRVIYDLINDDLQGWPREKQTTFLTAMQAQPADPWLVAMLSGNLHITWGWAARGNGYADTVSDQGWKTLKAEMAEARKCFEQAQQLHPEFPEAATQMLTVCLGESSGLDALRDWFDRATEAQVDYTPAYSSFLYGSLPRWFGNYRTMVRFGMECAASKRYDTVVPYYLLDSIQRIIADGHDYSVLNLPAVQQAVATTEDGYTERTTDLQRKRYYQSELAGFAWQMRRYDLGRNALEKLEHHPDPAGFDMADVVMTRTISGMYAMTGDHADAIKQAEALASAGKPNDAAAAYSQIATQLQPDEPALLWCKGRAQEYAWQSAYEQGEWVNLIGSSDLAGWYTRSGKFTCDGHSITGTTDDLGAFLICGLRLGPRWEVQTTFTVAALQPNSADAKYANAGLRYSFSGVQHDNGDYFQPGTQLLIARDSWAPKDQTVHCDFGNESTIDLQVVDGLRNGTHNGKVFLENNQIYQQLDPNNQHLAIGSLPTSAGSRFVVTAIKVRKLR